MAEFNYVALDRSGKQVKGQLSGADKNEAAARVRSLGYFPVELNSSGSSGGAATARTTVGISGGLTRPVIEGVDSGIKPRQSGKKVGRVHILLFTRELADLIDAGLPIDRALTVLIEQTDNASMSAMVTRMQGDIRSGKPLSESLRAFPREFPPLYANMIQAGEVSGQLAPVMGRLADFMEKESVRRSQVMAALTYPMVLIIVALSAVTFLLTFVIPKLQAVFKDLGADLPPPTRLLIATSSIISHQWWVIAGCIFGGVFAYRAWTATKSGRKQVDGFKVSVPLFGAIARKMIMARFVRTLGTLLGGGVPILEAMEISASAVGNVVAEEGILVARDGVKQGETLAHALDSSGRFLPLVVHMTAVGEETGRLPGMLVRTADTLDFEVDNAMRRLTSLVEPLIVLLMGGFVGFVVLSILLPIFQANTLVK